MRATKLKYSHENTNKSKSFCKKQNNKSKAIDKKVKVFSFIFAFSLAATALIVPTTTLAPDVDAFEDSKTSAYAIGSIDKFSSLIKENCVSDLTVPDTTESVTTEINIQKTETAKPKKAKKSKKSKPSSKNEEKTTKPVIENEKKVDKNDSNVSSELINKNEDKQDKNEVIQNENVVSTPSYLLEISNPDKSYAPTPLKLSDYDRAKLERLVMGEAGTMGYNGCALVAQSIRDAMNRSGTTSIDTIISEYKYYGSTLVQPNQTVKDAVSYIFDENGSAVQHRILCFYTGTSKWHETQRFIIGCGTVRFFDLTVE